MAKIIKLKILQNVKDKENGKSYKRNDEIEFSEKRAEELLKNPCLVKKLEEIEVQTIDKNEGKAEQKEKNK